MMFMVICGIRFCMLSNSPSIMIILTMKPALWYRLMALSRCFVTSLAVLHGVNSTVVGPIYLDSKIKMAAGSQRIHLQTVSQPFRWSFTCSGVYHTISLLIPARSSPKITDAHLASLALMGRLLISLLVIIAPKSLYDVCTIISCSFWAFWALSTSQWVKPSKFFQIIFTKSTSTFSPLARLM